MSMQNVKLSDIRIFKDWLSRVGEHRNPEDIGDVHASGKIFFSARTKFEPDYEPDSLKCIQASISRYLSDGEC
jgi:hypothetical protein